MKKAASWVLGLLLPLVGHAQYLFTVDLVNVDDDKVKVELLSPPIQSDSATYFLPKVVPGTYSVSDFGRFVQDFTATDKEGVKLPVRYLSPNGWVIGNAKRLHKISYWVEDTYDTKQSNIIFEPAGTNIEASKNFMVNTFGFFGYFDGMKNEKYQLSFIKPDGFYGSSALTPITKANGEDLFEVSDYMKLADSPIMYCKPDTTTLMVGGAQILVSVYSPNKTMTSSYVAENIGKILEAQRKYLGGTLPIEKYAFIVYLAEKSTQSGMMGALEHSYSSLYVLPEINPAYLTQSILDIAAHEFFHIITPLSIHSKEIHDFDFIAPKMSKHLWLYEGVTEYFASHVQIQYNIIELDQYFEVLRQKMESAARFNDTLPFTVMSANVLEQYKNQYGNVYEKGALIGLCLDIKLRSYSKGKYNLRQLLSDLAKEYGKSKPFDDDELFDKIASISGYPEIRTFFKDHVEGNKPLPLKETFALAGIDFYPERRTRDISFGNIGFGVKDTLILVADVEDIDEFGKKMGYKKDDIILSINGTKISLQNAANMLSGLQLSSKEGDKLVVEVLRANRKGVLKKKKLQSKLKTEERIEKNSFDIMKAPSQDQINTMRSWLQAGE